MILLMMMQLQPSQEAQLSDVNYVGSHNLRLPPRILRLAGGGRM